MALGKMATSMEQTMLLFITVLISLLQANALFEDQVGKFDWRHQYVGRVKFAAFEQSKHKRQIFVATESNVLASLNLGGQLNWRHLLRRGHEGVINSVFYSPADAGIVTLSGSGRILRVWNATNSYLKWETSVSQESAALKSDWATALQAQGESNNVVVAVKNQVISFSFKSGQRSWTYINPDSDSLDFRWLYFNKDEPESPVFAIGIVENSHLLVVKLDAQSGDLISQTPVSAAWAGKAPNCIIVSGGHFVCSEPSTSTLQFLNLNEPQGFSATSPAGLGLMQPSDADLVVSEIFPSSSGPAVFVLRLSSDHHALLEVKGQSIILNRDLPDVTAVSGGKVAERYVVSTAINKLEMVSVKSTYLDDESDVVYSNDVTLPGNHGPVVQLEVDLHEMRDKSITGRALIQTSDDAIAFMIGSGDGVVWIRDESLADTISVELVDLPVSATEARFEDEFGGKQGENILNMFTKRLSTQFAQFQSYLAYLKRKIESRHDSHQDYGKDVSITHASQRLPARGEDGDDDEEEEEYLIRDDFNLHKIIIATTRAGKIFGLDSQDGTVVWDHYLPDLAPFESSGKPSLPLYVQRTTAHFPNPPQCNIVGKSKTTGNALIFSFNPITGKPTAESSSSGSELPYRAQQVVMLNLMTDDFLKVMVIIDVDLNVVMLNLMTDDFLKVMVIIDVDLNVHILPPEATPLVKEHASSVFLFTAATELGQLTGYQLTPPADPSADLQVQAVWEVQLPTALQKITHVVGRRNIEHVHSQGRVLGDRSVLYKYLNPNLVAVVTEGEEIGSKPHISVYLIDVVTGAIIFSADHKKVQGPVHIVHTENWVVYQYWNSRFRRNEITVLELYEGKKQKNSTLFSSLDPPNMPLVERQSYILPSSVQALSATYTERGITTRHLLMVLGSGGVLSLPKRFLDPRRPLELKQEHKEEGLVQYLPELPLPFMSFVNYNQSVFGVTGIQTAPAGLESTCLVLAYGLDFYFTRVMPSNLFDVLKEDFDYMFILIVLIALVVAALSTRRLASLKALRQAWR